MSDAEKFAESCGLTLGTDQANAVITGYEGAIEHVSKDCEFDEAAVAAAYRKLLSDEPGWGELTGYIQGAKWQFEQMSVRVGLAETMQADAEINAETIHQDKIKSLEARIAESELKFITQRDAMTVALEERDRIFKRKQAKLAQALQKVAELEKQLDAVIGEINI